MTEAVRLKQDLQAQGQSGLALDIDDTLSDTLAYWIHHLSDLFGNPEGLTKKSMMETYMACERVPCWQTPEAIGWMQTKIHDNELQKELDLVPGAREHVEMVHQHLPIKAYITARPSSVTEGTLVWLNKHNFPSAPLITRPDHVSIEESRAWKADLLHQLYPQISGIVDDNPGLIQALAKDYRGTVYLLGADTHQRPDFCQIIFS